MANKIKPEDIDKYISRVSVGGRYARIANDSGDTKILFLKELELKDRVWLDFVYDEALIEGKANELASISELLLLLEETGVWTKESEKEIQGLRIAIAELEKNINGDETSRADKNKIKKLRGIMEDKLQSLERTKSDLLSTSLERYADGERIRAMAFCSTYTELGEKYWPTWNDFLKETDLTFIHNILDVLAKDNQLDTKTIREMARSPLWRFKWSASKDCDDLFGKPIIYLTRNQESLVYWSQVYDSAYESYERPPEDVINNDDALDKWFEEQARKRKAEEKLEGKDKNSLSKNISRHGEIGIVPRKDEDIQEIFDLNDPTSRKYIKKQENRIKTAGVITEQELRKDKESRRIIGASDTVFTKKRRPDGRVGKQVEKTLPGGTLKGGANEQAR